jgi:hypothetical protein
VAASVWAITTLATVSASAEPPAPAPAADDAARSNARQLATSASEAYRAGQWDLAYDRFNRAFKLVGVPALGVWSARSLEQSGKLVEASERYREVLAIQLGAAPSESDSQAQRDARVELDALLPRIPNVLIHVQNASVDDVKITLDGKRVPPELLEVRQRVNPGAHLLQGTRGQEQLEQRVELAERDSKDATFVFEVIAEPAVAATPTDSGTAQQGGFDGRTLGWVSVGVGAAFLASGVITGVVGLGKQSDLETICGTDHVCPTDGSGDTQARIDSMETMKTLSTVSFIGAGVFGALGATLLIIGGPSAPAATVTTARGPSTEVGVRFTPTSAQLFGRF